MKLSGYAFTRMKITVTIWAPSPLNHGKALTQSSVSQLRRCVTVQASPIWMNSAARMGSALNRLL
eukprot:4597944-Karenia_brevis.AAC.1